MSKLINEDGDPTSCGEVQAEAVMEQIKEWEVVENIVALVFDTTASNTGRYRGATIRLQKLLDRPVFFLGCKHYVYELIVKASWYSLFEADLTPNVKFFSDIQDNWSRLDTKPGAEITILEMDTLGKLEAVEFLKELLSRKNKRNEMLV